jgi:hypothetical protein
MPNYNPSTIARISELINGIRVDTTSIAAATYFLTGNTHTDLFNVYGRIKVHNMFGEVATADFGANACGLYFDYTSTTPSIAVAPISSVSDSLSGLKIGERISFLGGAVATKTSQTATPAISDLEVTPIILGVIDGIGKIGMLTATASITGLAVVKFSIWYSQMSDGAYVTAAI